ESLDRIETVLARLALHIAPHHPDVNVIETKPSYVREVGFPLTLRWRGRAIVLNAERDAVWIQGSAHACLLLVERGIEQRSELGTDRVGVAGHELRHQDCDHVLDRIDEEERARRPAPAIL